MTSNQPQSPIFQPTPHTKPFWDACRRGELTATRCSACGVFFLPAGPVCPHCWSRHVKTQRLSGRGEVATFTIYHQAYHPDFKVPYVIALIALREGPRLVSNIVGYAPEAVRVGMMVEVRYEERNGMTVPVFAPVEAIQSG